MVFKKRGKLENLLISSLIFTFLGFSSADNTYYKYQESKISGEESTKLVSLLNGTYYNDPTWDYGLLFDDTCSKEYNGILYDLTEKETINLKDISIMTIKSKVIQPGQYVNFIKEKGVYLKVKGSIIRFSFDEISKIYTQKGGGNAVVVLKDGEEIKGEYQDIPAMTSGRDFYTGEQIIAKKEVDFSKRINYVGNNILLEIKEVISPK